MFNRSKLKRNNITSRYIKRMYHKNVVTHFENPKNIGSFSKEETNIGTGLVGAPACGDIMKLQIKVDPKNCTAVCWQKMQLNLQFSTTRKKIDDYFP